MAQTMVNFRIDEDIKKNMEAACKEMGLSISAAFNIFAIKVGREKRIPFEINVDPFYSDENMEHLRNIIKKIDNGEAVLTEHELIEV